MVKDSMLEKTLRPFEKKLKAQERLRRRLGVKEVERPTYERYITGTLERFHSQKNGFAAMTPDNEYGKDFRKFYQEKTGVGHFLAALPQSELAPEDRLGQSLFFATGRLCTEYHPEPLPVTPPEGRYEVTAADRVDMSRLIKKVAMWYGADMVRITKIDPRWVYSDREVAHQYAIIIVIHHDREQLDTAPSHLSGVSTADVYSRLKVISTQLSDFIRGLGHDAVYRETLGGNPELLMVPLAIDAGVGEFARSGNVMSPEYGTNIRMKPVTTDLPLVADKPVSFGAHEFCTDCKNCAEYCPSNALPMGDPEDLPDEMFYNPGKKLWYVRPDRCLPYWMARRKKWISCGGRCLAVCPWNKKLNTFHNFNRWLAIHSNKPMRKLLVWADRITERRTKNIN